ncbi:MAG: prohibitin family protein [Pseudorhodoplanes sp.]
MTKYPELLDGNPPMEEKRGWGRSFLSRLPSIAFPLLVAFLAITILWRFVVITVPAGHVGVLWKRFNTFDLYCWCFAGRGTMLNPQQLRGEGLHLIWPWDKLYIYNLRLQSTEQTYNAISKEGVSVTAQINTRFQLLNNSIAVLHKFIGPNYIDTVISPEVGSQARQVISQYSAQQVYTSREIIQEKIRENVRRGLGANLNKLVQPEAMEQPDPKNYNDYLQYSIQILDTLVLSIELPPTIVGAINRQTEQFYLIEEYRHRVVREAEESKRKQIEANGIAAFQKTVSQGISDSYLRWRGIEATLLLSQSQNSKVVVIGSGRDGLPIILGNVDGPAAPASPRKGADGAPTADNAANPQSAPQNAAPALNSPGAPPAPAAGQAAPAPAAPPPGAPAPAVPGQAPPSGPRSDNSAPPVPDKKAPAAQQQAPAAAGKPVTFNLFDLSSYDSVLSRLIGNSRSGDADGPSKPTAERQ